MPDTPPKQRFHFSLLSLIFLLTTSAACFGLYAARQRNVLLVAQAAEARAERDAVEAENVRLREELGVITITDPAKFHVMQLDPDEDLTWAWRVYVPEAAMVKLEIRQRDRYGRGRYSEGESSLGLLEPGQQTLHFSIAKHTDGGWKAVLRHKHGKSGDSVEPLDLWSGRRSRSETAFGRETKVLEITEPTRLFKVHVEEREPREGNPFTAFVGYEVILSPRQGS